ncbi:MAG: SDR family oxidoreductase [Nitrosomonadales bacterium]
MHTVSPNNRPVALITGTSRAKGIGAAIALALAESGWDVAITYWRPYDEKMPWGNNASEAEELLHKIHAYSPKAIGIEANLADATSPRAIFDKAEAALGCVTAIIMSHCQSVDSNITDTSIESFDLHMAINARATWLLIREFGSRYKCEHGRGRIISITSDATVGNLPYGASKGAMDRIVIAATQEFKQLGITANVINPGATDTGWMSGEQKKYFSTCTPLGRVGRPQDCANLVRFLCSIEGGWVNGQLLHSNGGV